MLTGRLSPRDRAALALLAERRSEDPEGWVDTADVLPSSLDSLAARGLTEEHPAPYRGARKRHRVTARGREALRG